MLARLLKDLYRQYAGFRGRDYVLVAWEVPRAWATGLRATPASSREQ